MKKYLNFVFVVFFCSICSVVAQTPEELQSWLPEIEGWEISKEVEVFDPDNLFNRINGAAPLFIENNFREMTSMEYTRGSDYITIQAYRHATPEDAFGMYASERSSGLRFFPIGGEAQGDDGNIYFYAGNIYVKMWSNSSGNAGTVLQVIAKGLADKINPEATYPFLFKTFPVEGKISHTEAYITSNYIGHEFLKKVYTIEYKKNGQTFQVFLMDAETKQAAKEILDKYFTFTTQSLDVQEGFLMIKDKYNGNIPAYWQDRYIMGIFPENDMVTEADSFLKEMAGNLVNL